MFVYYEESKCTFEVFLVSRLFYDEEDEIKIHFRKLDYDYYDF